MNNGAAGKIGALLCRTLGALELTDSGGHEHAAVLAQPKRMALLVYLGADPGVFHRRDSLLALFWPELDQERARAALRQALTFLRHELGDEVIQTRGAEEVGIDSARFWCDAGAFEEAVRTADLEGALELYRGEFLTGFHLSECADFEPWLEEQRRRLRERAAEAAAHLADRAEAAGSLTEAARFARRALTLKPDDERALQRLVALLDHSGDRAGALREYEVFARRVRAEYQAQPSAATRSLVEAMREPVPAASPPLAPPSRGAAPQKPPGVPPPSGTHLTRSVRRLALVGVVGAVGIGGVLLASRSGHGRAASAPTQPAYARTAIAVLPFDNLNPEGPFAYLAGGLHQELLTQLSKAGALKVIAEPSLTAYAGPSRPPLRQVASDLGVGSVVEASVQVVGARLRVNVQLLDAATGALLWAERYDRTLDDAFAIESDVAQRIVTAVGATFSGAEQQAVGDPPTANAEAYLLHLQGREYFLRPGHLRATRELAEQLYQHALALDPAFALAHAHLSYVHGEMYWFRYDPSPERAARQRREARTALRLAPNLPESHIAVGVVHYFSRQFRQALDQFAIALKARPNDWGLWRSIGYANRRLGNWDEAIAALTKATQLNPRAADEFGGLGATYQVLHRYAEAAGAFDRALTLAPDLYDARTAKGWAYVRWTGEFDTLRAIQGPRPGDEQWAARWAEDRALTFFWSRQADSLLQLLSTTPVRFASCDCTYPASLLAAWADSMRGDTLAARGALKAARASLDSAVRRSPDEARLHVARGLVLAGLGLRPEALREVAWLEQSEAYRKDRVETLRLAENRATIMAQVGEADAALNEIERLLAGPSYLTVHTLRLNPLWDPLRGNPRFQALLTKYGKAEQ